MVEAFLFLWNASGDVATCPPVVATLGGDQDLGVGLGPGLQVLADVPIVDHSSN